MKVWNWDNRMQCGRGMNITKCHLCLLQPSQCTINSNDISGLSLTPSADISAQTLHAPEYTISTELHEGGFWLGFVFE